MVRKDDARETAPLPALIEPEKAHPPARLWSSRQLKTSQEKPACLSKRASCADHSNYSCKLDPRTYHSLCFFLCILKRIHDPANFLVKDTSVQPSVSTN
jgi:hypothetical protein